MAGFRSGLGGVKVEVGVKGSRLSDTAVVSNEPKDEEADIEQEMTIDDELEDLEKLGFSWGASPSQFLFPRFDI